MHRPGNSVISAMIASHARVPGALPALAVPAVMLLLAVGAVAGQTHASPRSAVPVFGGHGAGTAAGTIEAIWRRAGLALPPLAGIPERRVVGGSGLRSGGQVGPTPAVLWPAAQEQGEPLRPGASMLASAVLPGTGQFLQGNDRWVPYLALEIWGWISFFKRRSDAHDLAAEYRDLAWSVARRVSIGERRDTIFEYYEEMTHYASSGTFDSDPESAGIQPEFDGRTFNGDLWALSRGLFWGGQNYPPGTEPYEQALAYYLDRAIPPAFTWAWGDSFLEQQSFRELIRRSDEAYRTSTQFLGLILANHVVSAVDALVIGRLRDAGVESRFRIGSGFEPTGGRVPRLRIEATWRW